MHEFSFLLKCLLKACTQLDRAQVVQNEAGGVSMRRRLRRLPSHRRACIFMFMYGCMVTAVVSACMAAVGRAAAHLRERGRI